jgi:hypothetical protein
MANRGRPVGYELSMESKNKIRKSRVGKMHSDQTKNKISKSLKAYFKTPAGQMALEMHRLRLSEFMHDKWSNFAETDSFKDYCKEFSDLVSRMCTDMHKYNKELKDREN